MTERIAARKHDADSSLDADDISITSTVDEEEPEDGRFNVIKILAEDMSTDGLYYLIQWEGYPITASTWEPQEHVESVHLVEEWVRERQRQADGITEPFDLKSWAAAVIAEKKTKKDRHRRRREKRKRLGILVSLSASEHESELDGSSLDLNEAAEGFNEREDVSEPASKVRQNYILPTDSVVRDGDDVIMENRPSEEDEISKVPRQPRGNEGSYSSDEAGLSEDSLIMEFKAKAKRKEERVARRETKDEARSTSIINRKNKVGRKEYSNEKQTDNLSTFPSELPKTAASPAKNQNRLPAQSKARGEAPSRTGYTGTANRKIERPNDGAAVRGKSVARGAGAIRGSARGSLFKSRLSIGAPARQRKNLAAALLDPPKNFSHFKTPSMRRKAQVAGRNLADRPPDFDSIGPLYAPGQFKIRKRQSISRTNSETNLSSVPLVSNEHPGNDIEKNVGTLQLVNPSPLDDDGGSLFEEPAESRSNESASKKEQEKKALMEKIAALDAANRAARAKLVNDRRHSTGHLLFEKHPLAKSGDYEQDMIVSKNNDVSAPSHATCEKLDPSASSNVRDHHTNKSPLPHSHLQPDFQPTKAERPRLLQRMSMDAYRARNTTKGLLENGIQIAAVVGSPESEPLQLILTDIGKSSFNPPIQALLKLKKIEFSRTCLAADFQLHAGVLSHQKFATGNVFATENGGDDLDSIAENLILSVSGLFFSHPAFSILLFPSKCEEWKFLLPQDTMGSGGTAMLKYQLFGARGLIAEVLPQSMSLDSVITIESGVPLLERLNEDILGLRYKKLMAPTIAHGRNVNSFFFIFPSKAESLLNHVAAWLLACNPDRQIFTSQQDWSWTAFTEKASASAGVIIIHESLISIVPKIPRLMQLLQSSTIWEISESDAVDERLARLFPYGGAIFLTPSFLCSEPKRTYQMLKWFHQKLDSSPFWAWKLLGCFRLRQYLFDLAIEKVSQRQVLLSDVSMDDSQKELAAISRGLTFEECEARFLSYDIVDDMLPDDIATGFPYSGGGDDPDEDLSPILYAVDGIDQNDEKRLAQWFAYWSMSHLRDFRQFMVLGTCSSDLQSQRRSGMVTNVRGNQGMDELEATASPVNSNGSLFKDVPDPQLESHEAGCPVAMDVTDSEKPPPVNKIPTRIDETVPLEILEFIVITASDTATAHHYLSLANNSVPLATKMFFSESQSTGLDGADDSPFVDLITGSEPVHRSHTVQSDLQRAIDLFKSPPVPAPAPSPFSFAWPKRSDGPEDGKSHARDNTKSTRKSAPAIHSPASGNSSTGQSGLEREVSGSQDAPRPVMAGEERSRLARASKRSKFEWDGEPTTEWYARLRAEGGGWEHIEVLGWETAFKSLGVTDQSASTGTRNS